MRYLASIFLFIFIFVLLSISHVSSELHHASLSVGRGGEGFRQWRRSIAEQPQTLELLADNNTSFILAADRTYRKDPSEGYQYYTGGWNITSLHYTASVGFSATPLFILALTWFVAFGVVLLLMCCCFCCRRRRDYSKSSEAYALSLALLILFTSIAIIGGIVLYVGEGKFHNSTVTTLDYLVSQANFTAENLQNFTSKLDAAKNVGVDMMFLPADIQGKIDDIKTKLGAAATMINNRTVEDSEKIHEALDGVTWYVNAIAAVMLILTFLGCLLSILGMQFIVYILVIAGWVLVALTFLLCGVFLVFHNVVADTCVAMDDWVSHPHAHTALDNILPCVDSVTANESLSRSKEVTFQLVNLVNKVIVNISNANVPPTAIPFYFNQSGPLMPVLCNPYGLDMSNRTCLDGEANINDASKVWNAYICNSSSAFGLEVCTTVGRVTPSIYNQLTAAVSVSYGLYQYGPFLVGLEDCSLLRTTFSSISTNNCPGLQQYSKMIYIGLVMVSSAVMMSLVFWMIFARERRLHKYHKQFPLPPKVPQYKAV